MTRSKTNIQTSAEQGTSTEKPVARRSAWPPWVIFAVLTLLTILMALGLKMLVTGRF